MPSMLSEIWPMPRPQDYKVHFADDDGNERPLDVWVRSPDEWQGWQEYGPTRNHFSRRFIFSLMKFYPEPETWLYGGIYEVLNYIPGDGYDVRLTDARSDYIGRLKIGSPYKGRTRRVNLENHWPGFVFKAFLDEPYTGRRFPGIDSIDLRFPELESLVRIGRLDWRGALSSMKGVYLITDESSGKRYVGSAYGDQGIWSRWSNYAVTGHGGNVELIPLASADLSYCRKHFRFTLLEPLAFQTPDTTVIAREAYWKDVLMTRGGAQGLNRN